MESNDANEVMISGSDEANCPEATVEIKIKTLDSQTYTLRVNKYVPIPALKAQIATVTGVLSEQQRLICRGKVLKDDQLLSAYHVEDGHTLHLVARQPIPPSLESHPDFPATDQASNPSNQNNQAGPSVVVGTFNISEQGDGVLPDLSRIVSAVLGSFGIPNIGSANEGTDLREAAAERLSRTNVGDLRNSSGQQTDQAASRSQSIPDSIASLFPASVPLESLQLPAIPDSLTTLSQYSNRLRNEFTAHAGAGNSFQAARILRSLETSGQESDAGMRTTSGPAGLPTPSSLAEVMLSTRQIFTDQAAECLTQFTRLLEDQTNVTDPLARMNIQSNAIRSGVILQNLGAFLLELGRTTMTLRMGATPADAVVNAGPAVFISTAGPNPIMVQPLPFQPGTSFGAIPVETIQANSGWAGGSLGSGLLPRNIDIRIRTGPSMPSTTTSQRDPAGVQQSPVRSNPSGGNSIHQPAPEASGTPSSTRGPEVRVIPVRTVVAAVPASARRAPSDSSRGSMGLFYPVLARVQHVASGRFNNVRGSQTSEEAGSGGSDPGQQPAPDSALPQQDSWLPGADVNTPSGDGNQNGLDQMLRSMFPGGQIHVGEANVQGMGSTSVAGHVGTAQGTSSTPEAVSRVDDGGLGLSNLLRQIMPFISENTDSGSASLERASDVMDGTTETSTAQGRENPDRGSLSRRNGDPPSSPSSKRQRRE